MRTSSCPCQPTTLKLSSCCEMKTDMTSRLQWVSMPNNLIFLALHFTISKRASSLTGHPLRRPSCLPVISASLHMHSLCQFGPCHVSPRRPLILLPVSLHFIPPYLMPGADSHDRYRLNARRSLRKRTQFSTDFQPSLPVISLDPDPVRETERYPLHPQHPNDEPTPTASHFELSVQYSDHKSKLHRHRSRHYPRPLSDPGHVKLDVQLKIPEVRT